MKHQIRETVPTGDILRQINMFSRIACQLQAAARFNILSKQAFEWSADQSAFSAASLAVMLGIAEWLPTKAA